jgi:hypothetical protein
LEIPIPAFFLSFDFNPGFSTPNPCLDPISAISEFNLDLYAKGQVLNLPLHVPCARIRHCLIPAFF